MLTNLSGLTEGGFVVMCDEAMIDVSVRKKKDLLDRLNSFL